MNSRNLRLRLEKIEGLFATRGLSEQAPIDVSETLAIIASVRPDMVRLSEMDRKRWYCPDDPRTIWTSEEIEEEAKIKAHVSEKLTALGFPQGYSQRHYRKDQRRLYQIAKLESCTDFIRLSASEQADRTVIQARREGLYEVGPKYRADLRIKEIDRNVECNLMGRTIFEWHEIYHLQALHPDEPFDEEEIASFDKYAGGLDQMLARWKEVLDNPWGPKERLDEWHARKGEDPRLFRGIASWQLYPQSADAMKRQNQQLAEMGFEPDTTSCYARTALARP